MAQVLVRDLPDDVVERLRQRAQVRGESLEAHLRAVLADASCASREEFLEFARGMRERSGPQTTDSTDIIREARDAGYSDYGKP